MATIRSDLVGSIYVGGHVLHAGDEVPAGIQVHETLLAKSSAKRVTDHKGDDHVVNVTPEKPKRGRPKKAAESKSSGDVDADAS